MASIRLRIRAMVDRALLAVELPLCTIAFSLHVWSAITRDVASVASVCCVWAIAI
jgi:hypothetical protein